MKKFLKIVGLTLLGLIGVGSYFAFPDVQKFIAFAVIGFFVLQFAEGFIERAVSKALNRDLTDIRSKLYRLTERLDAVDGKVSAVWGDAHETRRRDTQRAWDSGYNDR